MNSRLRRILLATSASTVVPLLCAQLRAANISWNVDANGSWTNPVNWTSNPALPDSSSDVTINRTSGDFLITLNIGTQTIHSLTTAERLTISSGSTLAVTTTMQVNNALTLSGATLKGATLSLGATGQVTLSSGTFDGVTLASNLTVASATLNLLNGLTLSNCSLSVDGFVTLLADQTIGGNGVISFDGVGNGFITGNSRTLTLGPGISVRTGSSAGIISTTGLINQGLISARTSGMPFTLSGNSLINTGTLEVRNGGTLNINSNLTTAGLGTFNVVGGTFQINGTLDNSGSTLALNGTSHSLTLGGTISGGNISTSAGAVLSVNNGEFDGVTLNSSLTITDSALTTQGGLTLGSASITLNSASTTAFLSLTDSQTIGGTGSLIFDGPGGGLIQGIDTTLTLASGITTRTGTGGGIIDVPGLINQGLISARTSGQTLTLTGITLINNGTLQATGGGTLLIATSLTTAQLGNFNAAGGTLRIDGFLDNIGATLALNGAGNNLTLSQPLTGGAVSLSALTVLTLAPAAGTSRLSSVSLAGAANAWLGKMNLSTNSLIVSNGSNVPNQLKQAANFGAWNGAGGITSTAAQAAATSSAATALAYASGSQFNAGNGQTTFNGLPFNLTDTLILYTLAGDANMDKSVTFADFLLVQNNYNGINKSWQQGDFNYDGSTTFADFLILQNNYNKTLSVAAAGPLLPAGTDSVPEPASLITLALAIPLILHRRRGRARNGYASTTVVLVSAPQVHRSCTDEARTTRLFPR